MSLSCECGDAEERWYYGPSDYSKLATKYSRKCCSCKEKISVGDICVEFLRARRTNSDVEERIYGDEIRTAPWYMCERCGDLYFSLEELGFCIDISDSMLDLVKEYAEMQKAPKIQMKLTGMVYHITPSDSKGAI